MHHAALHYFSGENPDVLAEHLATAPRNATYTSKTIQNQMINIVADQIRSKIAGNIEAAKWYTVISDEVTDVSNKEQLSLVLSYVDSDTLLVREDLIGFVECNTGITGRELANKITSSLQAFGLDLSNLRGQAYDRASNMAGSVNGTAAFISAQYPLALYLHCASHCLNLTVVKSLQITSVQNIMGVIERVYQFFAAHPKRQTALEKAISDTHPTSKVHKLKDMCRTRWIQRIDAIQVFKSLHQCTVTCMEGNRNDGPGFWTPDALTDARSLQLAMTTTDFICAVVITNSCLKYLQALTLSLQAQVKDIVTTVNEIDNVTTILQIVRDNIGTHHSQWFSTVEKMCADVGTKPSLPRRSSRQIHRSNVPADTPSKYYCHSISIPMLDYLLSEIKTHFTTHQKTALLGLCIVPSVMVTLQMKSVLARSVNLLTCTRTIILHLIASSVSYTAGKLSGSIISGSMVRQACH